MAGAPNKPKGSVKNLYKPYGVEKAIFSLDCGDKGMCQYSLVKSSVVKKSEQCLTGPCLTQGMGYASSCDISLVRDMNDVPWSISMSFWR